MNCFMPPSFELFFAVPIVQVYGPNFPENKKQLITCFMCTAQIFLDVLYTLKQIRKLSTVKSGLWWIFHLATGSLLGLTLSQALLG